MAKTDLAELDPESSQAASKPSNPATHTQAAEPSGPRGDNPGTAGPGHTGVDSPTPENAEGHLNPSAPEDANITPGSAAKK
ncbi:hypothetical protein [Granulicella sp. dw_53]|uniref:hypothetical protein n=1 Tax=Granulicella sp. dw_53 TaxID=2719792 RepID=UPI001BD4F311|nr:hypothetical protein [Granulicella sp. dw_53]